MGTYNFKAVPEANWLALGAAVGAIVGAVMTAFSLDPYVTAILVAAITGLPRAIIGVLLPLPPKAEDKSI